MQERNAAREKHAANFKTHIREKCAANFKTHAREKRCKFTQNSTEVRQATRGSRPVG